MSLLHGGVQLPGVKSSRGYFTCGNGNMCLTVSQTHVTVETNRFIVQTHITHSTLGGCRSSGGLDVHVFIPINVHSLISQKALQKQPRTPCTRSY